MSELLPCHSCGSPVAECGKRVCCSNRDCWMFNVTVTPEEWSRRTPAPKGGQEIARCERCEEEHLVAPGAQRDCPTCLRPRKFSPAPKVDMGPCGLSEEEKEVVRWGADFLPHMFICQPGRIPNDDDRRVMALARLVRRLLSSTPPDPSSAMNIQEAWRLMAAWRPIGWVDHACRECIPHGEIVREGFQCAYHAMKRLAKIEETI